MEITNAEWRLILEMYAVGMGDSYEDMSESEIETVQVLFHRLVNMVNEING